LHPGTLKTCARVGRGLGGPWARVLF
jgi:hypothetical protein